MHLHRIPLLVLAFVLVGLGSAPDSEAAKRKKEPLPAVAVWDVYVDDANRAEAYHWYSQIAEAIDELPEFDADSGLAFQPQVRPAEGILVASNNAMRWLEGAWVAYHAHETPFALSLVTDARALVEPYPATRLPDGLLRDLWLLEARIHSDAGDDEASKAALRSAGLLDPWWRPAEGLERPHFHDLWDAVHTERSAIPPATLQVRSNEGFSEVLVHGVAKGQTTAFGELDLELPPGLYDIALRKPGFAEEEQRVQLRPRDSTEVKFELGVRNSAAFQEGLVHALAEPSQQRGAPVWSGLKNASGQVGAEGILIGRYRVGGQGRAADAEWLQIALYVPGRQGWGFYREVPLGAERAASQAAVDQLIADLVAALDAATSPPELAVDQEG